MPAPDKEEMKRQKAELEARFKAKQELVDKAFPPAPKPIPQPVYLPPPEGLSLSDLARNLNDASQDRPTGFEHIALKIKQHPLIPAGMLLTVFALANGLRSMVKNRQLGQQRMMRLRVFGQGFTMLALVVGTVVMAAKKQ